MCFAWIFGKSVANQDHVWTLRGLKLVLHSCTCILLGRSEVEAEENVGNTEKAKGKTEKEKMGMRDE